MNTYTTELYSILTATLFWLALLTFIVGIVMLLAPGWLLRISDKMNHWIDTSSLFRKLDEQQHFERVFYRHHIIMGLLITAGSLYSLWFIWQLQGGGLAILLPDIGNAVVVDILQATLGYVLLVGNCLALVVGLVVLLRPSALKGLEARANRWLESGRVLGQLDRQVEMATPAHPRLFGLLIMIGSLYIMSNTIYMLFRP